MRQESQNAGTRVSDGECLWIYVTSPDVQSRVRTRQTINPKEIHEHAHHCGRARSRR